MIGRLQFWLQGHPNKHRPWWVVRIGNLISDVRFWTWRACGGKWPAGERELPDPSDEAAVERFFVKLENNTAAVEVFFVELEHNTTSAYHHPGRAP